jgi:hypothetical protein
MLCMKVGRGRPRRDAGDCLHANRIGPNAFAPVWSVLAQTHVNLEDCAKSLGLVRLGEQLAVPNGDGTHGL